MAFIFISKLNQHKGGESRAPITAAVNVIEKLNVEEALGVSVTVGVSVMDSLLEAEGVMVEDEVVVGV